MEIFRIYCKQLYFLFYRVLFRKTDDKLEYWKNIENCRVHVL